MINKVFNPQKTEFVLKDILIITQALKFVKNVLNIVINAIIHKFVQVKIYFI